MKNFQLLLLYVTLTVAGISIAKAQCTYCSAVDSLCPSTGGLGDLDIKICGDTLLTGAENTAFSGNITFVMPSNFTIKQGDPIVPGFPIPSPANIINVVHTAELVSVDGLPTSLVWESDSSANGNVYSPPNYEYGCVSICGQLDCNSAGTYNITLNFNTLSLFDVSGFGPLQGLLQSAGIDVNNIPNSVSVPATLIVDPSSNLVLDITFPGTTTLIDSGETISLTAAPGFDSYLWSTGDTVPSLNVSPADTTTYVVTATDAGGCSQTDSLEVQVQSVEVGILELTNAATVKLYPNPNSGIFTLQVPTASNKAFSLRIFNLAGEQVLTKDVSFAGDKLMLDLGDLEKGVYLLQLNNADQALQNKLIIQ